VKAFTLLFTPSEKRKGEKEEMTNFFFSTKEKRKKEAVAKHLDRAVSTACPGQARAEEERRVPPDHLFS